MSQRELAPKSCVLGDTTSYIAKSPSRDEAKPDIAAARAEIRATHERARAALGQQAETLATVLRDVRKEREEIESFLKGAARWGR